MPQKLLDRIQSQLGKIQEGLMDIPEDIDLGRLQTGIREATERLKPPSPTEAMPTTALEGERLIEDRASVPDALTTSIQDMMTGTAGIEDFYKSLSDEMARDTARRAEIEESRQEATDRAKEFMATRPTFSEMEGEARSAFLERFGLPQEWEAEQMQNFMQMQSEIIELRGQLDAINIREQQALLNAERQSQLTSITRGEQAFIQRQFAIEKAGIATELSSKAAIAEMYRGNIDMAERYIKDYINAATYDLQQQKEEIFWFKDHYQAEYNALDTDIKNSINSILQFVEREETLKRNELSEKMGLIRRAAEQGVNLGISGREISSMSIEEMSQLYSERIGASVMARDMARDKEDVSLFWDSKDFKSSKQPVWFDEVYRKILNVPPNTSIRPEMYQRVWDQYRNQVIREGWTEPTGTQKSLLEHAGIDWRLPSERGAALDLIHQRDSEFRFPTE